VRAVLAAFQRWTLLQLLGLFLPLNLLSLTLTFFGRCYGRGSLSCRETPRDKDALGNGDPIGVGRRRHDVTGG
jgi:hypothetical protein